MPLIARTAERDQSVSEGAGHPRQRPKKQAVLPPPSTQSRLKQSGVATTPIAPSLGISAGRHHLARLARLLPLPKWRWSRSPRWLDRHYMLCPMGYCRVIGAVAQSIRWECRAPSTGARPVSRSRQSTCVAPEPRQCFAERFRQPHGASSITGQARGKRPARVMHLDAQNGTLTVFHGLMADGVLRPGRSSPSGDQTAAQSGWRSRFRPAISTGHHDLQQT